MSKLPFVEKIEFGDPVHVGTPVPIKLHGKWPTPTWEHVDTTIDIDPQSQSVIISYFGTAGAGMAIQVIATFEDDIMVTFPESGEWTLRVKGRTHDVMETLVVREN